MENNDYNGLSVLEESYLMDIFDSVMMGQMNNTDSRIVNSEYLYDEDHDEHFIVFDIDSSANKMFSRMRSIAALQDKMVEQVRNGFAMTVHKINSDMKRDD